MSGGVFEKTGGTVYGSDAIGTDTYGFPLENTASRGAAVCVDYGATFRDTTLYPADNWP
jgi:hypothetical protein